MNEIAVGIDGGASHTQFVAVTSQFEELARLTTGPSNFRNLGIENALDTLKQGITGVMAQTGLPHSRLSAVGLGLSGVDSREERALFEDTLAASFPGIPIVIENDAVAALIGGTGQRIGITAISGTGSIVVGIDGEGHRARAGGWGYHLDHSGGYAIARDSIAAVMAEQDGLGPATKLSARIATRLNIQKPRDLINWLYAPERRVDEIAALAAETIALADDDPVAAGIIAQAADALSANVLAVAKQLHLGNIPFPVLMAGSIFEHSVLLRELFAASVRSILPDAVVMLPERNASVGAAIMALAHLGISLPTVTLPSAPPLRPPSEQRDPLTRHISQRPIRDVVMLMNREDRRIPRVIEPELPHIAALIEAIAARFSAGGRLILAGAGTSGRLAVLDAAECVPTFNTSPDQVIGLMAGGRDALTESIEGAEDSEAGGRAALVALNVGVLDSVIGIAASGATPFVQGILREAAERGALTGSITNRPHAPISGLAQHPITLVTGPEVIMGSTRLKAGTSQKMVLNMITTGLMVRIGKTYGNLMVDMIPSNEKLRKRACVMVAEAAGLALSAASDLLARCGGEVKTAIAVALTGVEPEVARRRLQDVQGNLNRILG